jgi:hypothetical protein
MPLIFFVIPAQANAKAAAHGRWIPAFERVKKALGQVALRPSTARYARAQDEEIFFVPQRIHLILSLSKDALRMCKQVRRGE